MPGFIDDIEDYIRKKIGLGTAEHPEGAGGKIRDAKIDEATDYAVTGVRKNQSSDSANGYGGAG